MGFSEVLVNTIRRVAAEHIAKYPVRFPGEPLITFEKNILGAMTLTDILMDTAGVDIANPPLEDADLSFSSIDQSIRDLIWSRMGGKVAVYNYIQSSLDGVVKVANAESEAIAIRYLNSDPTLSASDIGLAKQIMDDALDDKEEGCRVLNLCAFVADAADDIDAAQLRTAMEVFQGISVVKEPSEIEHDIYFKASMADLERRARSGRLPLRPIKPFGGAIFDVGNFIDAARLTEALLKCLTWEELREYPDRTYEEWLEVKASIVAPLYISKN
jgi:hypothetical protein